MKRLCIDYYVDGFNSEHISCWDLSIACACGFFEKELYYIYCFLYGMMCVKNSFESVSCKILDVIGLQKKEIQINTKKDLIKNIKYAVESKTPALVKLCYNTIFYDNFYKKNTGATHLMLISGYDEEKQLVNVKDNLHTRDVVNALLTSKLDIFSDFKLKEHYLEEMWEESKEQGINDFIIITKEKAEFLNSYNTLITYYLENEEISEKTYNKYKKYNIEDSLSCNIIRRNLYHSREMMVDVLKRAFKNENFFCDNVVRERFELKLDEIIETRNLLVGNVLKLLMKSGSFDELSIKLLIENDRELYESIKEMYNNGIFLEPQNNLAYKAITTCDSENEMALSSNTVNGTIKDDIDCWISDYKQKEHWIIVDMEKTVKANLFVVKHHPFKKILITKKFRIEGSNDLNAWTAICNVLDNNDYVNIFSVNHVEYRYFRLYIEKANAKEEKNQDDAARIFSFEIYDL